MWASEVVYLNKFALCIQFNEKGEMIDANTLYIN